MNNKNYEIITNIALVSIGFYVIFAYNNIIDKLFLGSGKAHMLFLQSFITNIVVFIPYYYLVSIEKLEDIAIMIGIAMSFDAILTFAMFFYYVKKFEFSDKKIVHV
jgi:Na+-driven multidrug efflux pump